MLMIDSRVSHRGMGGFGYCVDCESKRPGTMCPATRDKHPRIWAREAARLAATEGKA